MYSKALGTGSDIEEKEPRVESSEALKSTEVAQQAETEADVHNLNGTIDSFDEVSIADIEEECFGEVEAAATKDPKGKKKQKMDKQKEKGGRLTDRRADEYEKMREEDMKDSDDEISSTDSADVEVIYTRGGTYRPDLFLRDSLLKDLNDLPSLSDFSLTSEDEDEWLRIKHQFTDSEPDVGHFVDPISGEALESLSSSDIYETQPFNAEGAAESDESDEYDLIIVKDETPAPSMKPDMDGMAAFEEFKQSLFATEDESTVMDGAKMAELYKLITTDFLNKLLDYVVEEVERDLTTKRFVQSLDKKRVFEDIDNLIIEYEKEFAKNKLLLRKVVDHFKRSKAMAMLDPLGDNIYKSEKEKYDFFLGRIDQVLLAKDKFDKFEAEFKPLLLEELQKANDAVKLADESFERTVRNTLVRPKFTEMSTLLESELKTIMKKRDEINKTRYELINRQHTVALLQEELTDLEYITDELKISTFLSLQTDCLSLDKKLEEQEAQVKRYYTQYNSNLHILVHLKEKQKMISKKSEEQKIHLAGLNENHRNKREDIFEFKLERKKIRQQIQTVSIAGGLLDNTALMYDFDRTNADIANRQLLVNGQKKQFNECLHKLARVRPHDSILKGYNRPSSLSYKSF